MIPKIHFLVLLWGNSYTHSFLSHTLPTLMSPGNLGAFFGREGFIFHLITTKASLRICKNAPIFKKLKQRMQVNTTTFVQSKSDVYEEMAIQHRSGVELSNQCNAAFAFLPPDMLYADGSLLASYHEIQSGYDAVFTCGARVNKESILKKMDSLDWNQDGSLSVTPELLTSECLKRLHSWNKACFVGGEKSTGAPAQLYWMLTPNNVLIRGFHYHPLMIYPKDKKYVPRGTLDLDYVGKTCKNPKLMKDNSKVCLFEYTDSRSKPKVLKDILPHPHNPSRIAAWASRSTDSLQRSLFLKKILMLTDYTGSPEQFSEDQVIESEKFADRVMGLMNGDQLEDKPRRYRCVSRCFYQNRLWDEGQILVTDKPDVPRHFKQIKG